MISVDDISKIADRKKELLKQTYTHIYEQSCKRIKKHAEFGNKHVFVEIPGFVMGYPSFDRYKAVQYIFRQLTLAGFICTIYNDFVIHVTWALKKAKPTKSQEKSVVQQQEEEFGDLPSFINLKKAANRYRGK